MLHAEDRLTATPKETVPNTALAVVRILIASYFLAAATGLVFQPASRTFLDAVLPTGPAQFVTTTYLYVTAFAIMVGFAVRPAALLLAIYIFWSAFVQFDQAEALDLALSEFWRDVALIGALTLVASTEPGTRRAKVTDDGEDQPSPAPRAGAFAPIARLIPGRRKVVLKRAPNDLFRDLDHDIEDDEPEADDIANIFDDPSDERATRVPA